MAPSFLDTLLESGPIDFPLNGDKPLASSRSASANLLLIFHQTCAEMGVHIVRGVLARDHVHMFLPIPPKLSLIDVMQRIKGRSSRRIQMKFPELRKRYWGMRFWAREYFSTTSGNVTDDIIMQYLELHSAK